MPFIPHTDNDEKNMLERIGVEHIEGLFDEIPLELRSGDLSGIPEGLSEMALNRLVTERSQNTSNNDCYIGAGAYEHHIPAAVWDITSRGEFLTAYTPYQAEASQGTLQLLYEYQTMMANLTGMDVSNASMYDGASALAEAILMAVRANRRSKSKRILVLGTIHPNYRQTVHSIVHAQNIELITLDFSEQNGTTPLEALAAFDDEDITAIAIQQPNFFGALEQVDQLSNWAHAKKALVIAAVNPTALAIIKEPGQWGNQGADIVCGEGQPLGIPMASGGPYFGFLCCKQAIVRQMPGRIIGRTLDKDGKTGYTLTLQAREQHIRRSKATSNICTNQGLLVTAATVYMSLLGEAGLKQVALHSHNNTLSLLEKLKQIKGVQVAFDSPFFHEVTIRIDADVESVLERLQHTGISGGYPLTREYPTLPDCLVICVTETKTEAQLEHYAKQLDLILNH